MSTPGRQKPPPKESAPATQCWFCQRPNPRGSRTLGDNARTNARSGTRVAACEEGRGCRDGRIYHGPTAPSHDPEDACLLCNTGPPGRAGRAGASPPIGTSMPTLSNRFRPA